LESQADRFGAAIGKLEPTSVVPPGGATAFGAAGLARKQLSTAATGDGGFGGVEIGRAERRTAPSGEAGFGAAERRQAVKTSSEPAAQVSRNRPVKILWKPVPKYSEEGIRRRIEGDVVLLVRFLAQGRVETLEVVSGLGHGLDEYARQAAESIRFEPATQANQPVDFTAQVRIRFELAY
jgi:TonB family protein